MGRYVITCTGSEREEQHELIVVAYVDDNRANGGGVVVHGTNGFEDMTNHPSGHRTYRLRCTGCGWGRNFFIQEATAGQVVDCIARIQDQLGTMPMPPLPPQLELSADPEHIRRSMREQFMSITTEEGTDGGWDYLAERRIVIPFGVLDPLVKTLRTVDP